MKEIDLHLINVENEYKRAINHAFDLGWDACEERIIKLLEEQVCLTYKALPKACMDKGCHQTVKLIALIKGEK